jgi:hypothetical protein
MATRFYVTSFPREPCCRPADRVLGLSFYSRIRFPFNVALRRESRPAATAPLAGPRRIRGFIQVFARPARSSSGRGLGRISIYLETSPRPFRSPKTSVLTFRASRKSGATRPQLAAAAAQAGGAEWLGGMRVRTGVIYSCLSVCIYIYIIYLKGGEVSPRSRSHESVTSA